MNSKKGHSDGLTGWPSGLKCRGQSGLRSPLQQSAVSAPLRWWPPLRGGHQLLSWTGLFND